MATVPGHLPRTGGCPCHGLGVAPANRKPPGWGGTRRSPGPVASAAPVSLAGLSAGRVPFRRCPDDGMNPCLGEEHGEIPRRGQSPVAGPAAELASCPHGIDGRPAPDSSAVVPDVHADRHAVSIGQLQRLGCDLFALGRVALLVQELQIPAAVRSAVNPGDDVIDRGAATSPASSCSASTPCTGTWPTSSASSASPPAPRPRPGARAPGSSENSEQPRYKRRPPRLPTAQWRTERAAKCDTP